jgi:hypothetical protein
VSITIIVRLVGSIDINGMIMAFPINHANRIEEISFIGRKGLYITIRKVVYIGETISIYSSIIIARLFQWSASICTGSLELSQSV